jgi:hypothetical protein
MGKGCVLWLLGVPSPVILLYLFFHHRCPRAARGAS